MLHVACRLTKICVVQLSMDKKTEFVIKKKAGLAGQIAKAKQQLKQLEHQQKSK